MTQSDLQTWWQQQQFDFPQDKLETINCALNIAVDVSTDLTLNTQYTSKDHLLELIKILNELQADDEVMTAALLFHVLRTKS